MNKRRKKEQRARNGFTLIEVMLVVVIIGILAAVVVTRFTGQGDKARRNATRISIQNICTAIDAYEMEMTRFPSSLADLTVATEERGAFFKDTPNDSWGNPFQYKSLGKFSYEVRSSGSDGNFGTSDDLLNN